MKKNFIKICALVLLSAATFSCKKEYDDKTLGPVEDSIAPIPVTVINADFFERFPIINAKGAFNPAVPPATVPVAIAPTASQPGTFSITFSIPADKGTIREITRVVTGAAGLNYLQNNVQSVAIPAQGNTPAIPARAVTPNELSINFNGTAANPTTAPIRGNGTNTITYTSSLLEYNNYRNRVGALLGFGATGLDLLGAAPLLAAAETLPTQIRYSFLLTLEDGTQIIPTEVRVRVVR